MKWLVYWDTMATSVKLAFESRRVDDRTFVYQEMNKALNGYNVYGYTFQVYLSLGHLAMAALKKLFVGVFVLAGIKFHHDAFQPDLSSVSSHSTALTQCSSPLLQKFF